MSNEVQFEDENFEYRNINNTSRNSSGFLENLVIKTGIAKDKTQANYILLGFAVAAIVVSLFLFFSGSDSNGADLIQQELYPEGSSVLR